MKKILPLVLCMAFFVYASAATVTVEGITYTLNDDGTAQLTSGKGCTGDIVIPDIVETGTPGTDDYRTYRVTTIGSNAFRDCTSLISITIPDLTTRVGNGAFWGCTGLQSVHISDNMQVMGIYTFYNCTSLVSVHIPANVNSIGEQSFQGCTSLKEITVDEANKIYASVDGVLYAPGRYLLAYPSAKPETSLVIPEGVALVKKSACYKAVNLKSVTFPSSMKNIEVGAFQGCKRLKTVITNDSLISISASAFEDCIRLESFNIPEGVELIGNWAFSDCGLLSVTLPSTVATIGRGVFSNCGNLVSAVINSPTVGESNFNGCYSLESVTLGSGVNTIGGFVFGGCAMTTIDIPEGVTSIGTQAFQSCKQLTSVTIPKSVTSLGTMVFRECSALDTVVCKVRTPIVLSGEYFSGLPLATATLYVPRGSKSLYEAATGWNEFTSIVELPGITGDINNDDMVDVSDVSAVVDYILGSGIYTAAECDVNGDGAVDVGDVSALIDIILQ